MGTNFFRLPSHDEVKYKHKNLILKVQEMDISNPKNIERGFKFETDDSWDSKSPWDEFIDGMSIHLGKRSGGWKFCWNFHDKKYYSNKEELLAFIRSGRIVDEYGTEYTPDEFINMALNWGEPNGLDTQTYYKQNPHLHYLPSYDDTYIDGLRVSSSTEFS
jgi:hypothetical protein